MKLLFLDQFSEMGGGQHCLADLAPAVTARGWRAVAGIPPGGSLGSRLGEAGFEVRTLPLAEYGLGRKRLFDHLRFAMDTVRLGRAIVRWLEAEPFDLIYVNGPRMLPAASLAAAGKVPLVFHAHHHPPSKWARSLVVTGVRRGQATVIAASRYAVSYLAGDLPPARLHIVYPGVSGCAGDPGRMPGTPQRIGVLGRISPEKGQALFLEAVRLVAPRIPGCRFLIAGAPLFADRRATSFLRQLTRRAEGLPVDLVGWCDDPYRFLRGIDLLVIPSVAPEAAPRVLLEALSCAVPVVAFAQGGIPELIEDGRTGFLVAETTPSALAACLAHLLVDAPERLHRVGLEGRRLWSERFRPEGCLSRILTILHQAGSTRPAR